MTNTTYANLLTLIDNHGLTVGEQYRITDYVTTVKGDYSQLWNGSQYIQMVRSAGHPFDVIVTATGKNTISTDATAVAHSGDTYFSGQDLSQWQLKYITEYGSDSDDAYLYDVAPWAVEDYDNGGKGAVYWMRDEYGNEAWYDFKNIEFNRYTITGNIATSDTMPAGGKPFVSKLKQVFADNVLNIANFAIHIHQYAKYICEKNLYNEDDSDAWGGAYTLSDDGTRLFAVLYESDGQPKAIAQVTTQHWFHTFARMTDINDGESIDHTLTGNVTGCIIAEQLFDTYYNILPESIFLSSSASAVITGYIIGSLWTHNTVKQGFTVINSTQPVTNSLMIAGGTLYLRGTIDNVVIYNATGTRTVYANSNAVLFFLSGNYWYVQFVSRADITYQARIYGAPGSTPIQLTGAAQPFTTQEDTSNDPFLSLRKQSGYMRVVVNESFDYSELLPSDNMMRPVVLVSTTGGESVEWIGFLQSLNFNLPFLDYRITLSLPLTDSLSNLSNVMFQPDTSNAYITLAGILYYAITILNVYEAVSYEEIVLGNIQDISTWLTAKVSVMMFYETDSDGVTTPKYDCQEVIENMMTFLGMTLRVRGQRIYILAPGEEPTAFTISISELKEMAEGNIVQNPAYSPLRVNTFQRQDNPYCNTGQIMKVIQGSNDVTVTHSREMMDVSWSMPADEIADKIFATTDPTRQVVDDKQLYTLAYRNAKRYETNEWSFSPVSCKLRIWELRDTTAGPYFDWNVGLELSHASSQYYSSNAVVLRSKNPIFLKDCVLEIQLSGGTYDTGELDTEHYVYQPIIIKVGNYYFDHWKWVGSQVVDTFCMIQGGNIICNRNLEDKGAEYTGYGAPVTTETLRQTGVDYFFDYITIILQRPATYDMTYTSLSVNIIPNEKSGTDYSNDKKIHLTSDFAFNRKISRQSIFVQESDDAPLINRVVGVDTKNGNTFDPAEDLARRILDYYSAPRSLFNLHLNTRVVALNPDNVVPRTADGKTYYPVSISDKWRDSEQDVILMEMDTD